MARDATHPSTLHNDDELTPPSDLCRFYIHGRVEDIGSIVEDDFDPEDALDPDDDTFWPPWSPNEQQPSLQVHLRNALEHSDFSTIPATDLPVAIPAIAKAADEERSNELLLESLGFSIISQNLIQIDAILRQLNEKKVDPSSLYPFHMAASFLNGSETCCDVIFGLSDWISGAKVHKTYLNEHGHTILDNLMITIIKSHTSAKPFVVDENFKDVARFVGEEGLDPSVKTDISVTALLSLDSFVECDHVELTAAELAEEIMVMPASGIWNTKITTGWTVLVGVLHRCEAAHIEQVNKRNSYPTSFQDRNPVPLVISYEDNPFMGFTEPSQDLKSVHYSGKGYSPCFAEQKQLGALWSSIQAELLSYRRLNDGHGWTSRYFSMETLREQLGGGEDLAAGYTEHNLLKAHCACHSFGRYWPAMLSDAVDPNLANLNEVPERAAYGKEPTYWQSASKLIEALDLATSRS
ncbi:unnamed protein product [Alternaria alternata]